ncbi:hypothetical protein [Tenacibaculum piscium]|nr:hypothetical protein [Tenacibaculum piscium]
MANHHFKMTSKGFECIDCNSFKKNNNNNDDDDDDDENENIINENSDI